MNIFHFLRRAFIPTSTFNRFGVVRNGFFLECVLAGCTQCGTTRDVIMSKIRPSLVMLVLLCSLSVASYGQQGSISGTVVGKNGSAVPGARVTLVALDSPTSRMVLSDQEGRFNFTELAPGRFKFTVTSAGMETYSSPEIVLRADEKLAAPEFQLPLLATSTNIQVMVSPTGVAQGQLKAQEQQRALGVVPNFYISYVWNAAPLSSGQKYQLALRAIRDPFTFAGAALFAGIGQAENGSPEYGQGAQGYAKRFGAAYGDEAMSRLIGSAILPSLLHQDPRYFFHGSGSKKSRALYAVSRVVICRGDNGRAEPNYSYVLGSFASGGLANLYHPGRERGVGLTLGHGLLNVASHGADNLVREFVLHKITPKVPDTVLGKPQP
jgi:hypothetical protein